MKPIDENVVLNDKADQMTTVMLRNTGRLENREMKAYTAFVYNNAVQDLEEFIDHMIKSNPQYTECLLRLKKTMFPGMYMGPETK